MPRQRGVKQRSLYSMKIFNDKVSMKKCGIYKIECIANGRYYIGGTASTFRKRLSEHLKTLRRNMHDNILLQQEFNRYSEAAFLFNIIKITEIEKVQEEEREILHSHYGNTLCLNQTTNVGGGFTLENTTVKLRHREGLLKSYENPELLEVRRQQGQKNASKMREAVGGEKWKQAHLEGVRALATRPEWLETVRARAVAMRKKVGTDLGEVFESLQMAEQITGAHRSSIRKVIAGKCKTAKGRKWFFLND